MSDFGIRAYESRVCPTGRRGLVEIVRSGHVAVAAICRKGGVELELSSDGCVLSGIGFRTARLLVEEAI